MKKNTSFFSLCAAMLLTAQTGLAQETGPKVIPENAEGVATGKDSGFHPMLDFKSTFALGHSQNSPSTPDGLSLQLGYIIGAKLDYLSPQKQHEWANSLGMELAFARTPVLDAFIKSVDTIDFRSAYLYHIKKIPWFGPFIAFRLSTPMLQAHLIRSNFTNVIRHSHDETASLDDTGTLVVGTNEADAVPVPYADDRIKPYDAGSRIMLTEAFAPLTLRESFGFFAVPVDKPALKFDSRLGFGAWETFVNDGYILDKELGTDANGEEWVSLKSMQNSVQFGPELGIILSGKAKDVLTYSFSALFMYPIAHNADTNLEGGELMNMEFEAKVGLKLTKYVGIDYSFKGYKQPLIVDEWQIQNNLLVTIGFTVPEPPPPPPACPPEKECPACPEPTPPAPAPAHAADAPAETAAGDTAPAAGSTETAETVETAGTAESSTPAEGEKENEPPEAETEKPAESPSEAPKEQSEKE